MKVKRYQAATSREALARVKKDLGADAVILSNRQSAGGVEILALASQDVGVVTDPQPPAKPAPRKNMEQPLKEFAKRVDVQAAPVEANPGLREELRAMRELVEQQLSGLTWVDGARRNPARANLMRELLAAGFSAPLGRKITAALPAGTEGEAARAWLRGVLEKNLRCKAAHDGLVEGGGVFALTGPTGVGKTTSIAKIAARCVVRFGAQSVALISTDAYRIGAHDQLRIYAKILGVPVHTAQDPAGLSQAIDAFPGRRLVLIDTVGMGQRDARLAEQLDILRDPRIQRIVLLNAACQVETLEEVASAYGGAGAAGAVITKLDEARRMGGAIDVAMRNRLVLHYVTDGQRVPEDIRVPKAAELLAQAFAGAADSPFALRNDELFGLRAA
jgi:flagellar biosynthesis protein FlhF